MRLANWLKIASVGLCIGLGILMVEGGNAQESPAPMKSPGANAATQPPGGGESRVDEGYRIGPGDVLEIRIFERPQLSRDAIRVDGNGRIRMPLIPGDFVAACQTEPGFAEEIAAGYKTYLKDPQVDVFVKEFSSEPVAVIGAVNKPGSFQLQRRIRLRELLTFAGGPSLDAGGTIQVIHDENGPSCDRPSVNAVKGLALKPDSAPATTNAATEGGPAAESLLVSISLHAMLRGEAGSNPYIRPGDFIHVPKADQVFVVGNVYKPSTLALTDPLSVSRAIAMAGGVLAATKKSKIRIIRAGADGNQELFVDLEQINKHEQPDLLLEANDIVEVPTSLGKIVVRAFFTGIVPAYAIYGPLTLIH
jgi:polysaccharide biosynthesis/export protein